MSTFGRIAALGALALVTASLGGCRARHSAADARAATAEADNGYLVPPQPDTVRLEADGVLLSGRGSGGVQVRLARPNGEAIFAVADARGRWTIELASAADPRIFGLSAISGARTAQAQGYLLVTPTGQAALLRAGAGALRIDVPSGQGLRAIDFDAGGGLEITAVAPPRATVILRLDGRQVAEGRADDDGRYVVSLPPPGLPPIRPGAHAVQVAGDGFNDTATIQLSPAQPLADGPLRSQLTPAGLRVDWMTPSGGLQSTILVH